MKPPVYDPSWPAEVQELYRHDMQEIWSPSLAPWVYGQYQNQLELYKSFALNGKLRILDVGCAQATLAMQLAENGHKVVAVDLRPQFLEYAKTRYSHGDITYVCANILEDQIDGHFDLIFANQIIEHLVYPLEMLQKLRSLLVPNGRLVVSTPNAHYFRNALPTFSELGDPAQWEHRQFTADGDGHFFAYTSEELIELFRGANLKDVQCHCFETPFVSGHMKVRHLYSLVPQSVLKKLDRFFCDIPPLARRLGHQLLVTGTA